MSAGGVTCGVYPTSAPEQIAYVVGHSESRVLFVENEEQVDKVLQIIEDLKVAIVIVWDPKGLWGFSHEKIIFYDEFLKKGRQYLNDNPACITERMNNIGPDDTAMIIYTSGTTGRPKGAMLTHKNILSLTDSFVNANLFMRRTRCSHTSPWPISMRTSSLCFRRYGREGPSILWRA